MQDRLYVHSIEYPITEHCNLRCANCDHASPLLAPHYCDLQTFQRDLQSLAAHVTAGDLRILGGEPLLHPQLLEFLRIARTVQVSCTITLVTNGLLLHTAPSELWSLIDRLWVSVYPRVVTRMTQEEIRLLCERHGVVPDIRVINSFHQTLVNHRNHDPISVGQIYRNCKLAHEWQCYTVYEEHFYKCAPSPFLAKRLARRDISVSPANDGVYLGASTNLRERLADYLTSPDPLVACSYCLGSSGPEINHQQLNGAQLLKILSDDDLEYPQLLRPTLSDPQH